MMRPRWSMFAGSPLVLSVVLVGMSISVGDLGPAPAWGDESPPRDLHLVDDHWTAWDPPTDFPPEAEVYVIVRGDTLWDLADRFYGDPYLWPQLWEQNQYIEDAHWIYPGDPLLLSLEVTPAEEIADVELEEEDLGPEDRDRLALDREGRPPEPLGSESDIYCTGYIGEVDEEFGYRIIGSEYSALSPSLEGVWTGDDVQSIYGPIDAVRFGLATGDVIYVDGGMEAGLSPGEAYSVVTPADKVEDPVTGEVVGRLYDFDGRIQILTVQEDVAIAEIVQACDPIRVGSALVPFTPEPVPLGRRSEVLPINDPVPVEELAGAPIILHSEDDFVSLGESNVVYIDRGSEDGVAPGDLFTIYRINQEGLPPVVLGELAVLSAHSQSSVARIINSRYTVYVGDRLQPW